MFLSAVGGDFSNVSFFPRLGMESLARLESTCRGMREMVRDGGAWLACLEHSLPEVSLQGEVRAAADRGAAAEERLEVKRLLEALAAVQTFAPGCGPLPVARVERARELAAAVGRACEAARAHAEAGGHASRIIVGHFYFPNAMALPASALNAAPEDLDGGVGSLWSVSSPLHFALARPLNNKRHKKRLFPILGEELCLRLAWRGDSVLARATRRGASVDSNLHFPGGVDFGRELAVDVRALGSAPILRSRGTMLRVGGPWRKVSGVCGSYLPRDQLGRVLSAGLPCVVCVRDTADVRGAGECETVTSQSAYCANALNLEVSARQGGPGDVLSMLSFLPEIEEEALRPSGPAVDVPPERDHRPPAGEELAELLNIWPEPVL